MSITSTNTKHVYNGNGVTQLWPYTFPIIDETDIEVYITDDEENIEKITSNFTVDIENSRVEYPTVQDPIVGELLPSGWKITLLRVEPLTQEVDWKNRGKFNAEVLEQTLDKLTMIAQQQKEEISRAVKFPVDETPSADDTDTFLSEIEAAKVAAETAANEAEASAESASGSASAANGSAVNAATSEGNALTYKNNAKTSEDNAAASESNALSYKNSALSYKDTAVAAAATATAQAGIATTKAGDATTQAGIATTKASDASGYASDALSHKNAAESAAGNAATSENNAHDSEVAAASSADSITSQTLIKVRNNTGSTITGKIVKVVGDYSTDGCPLVGALTDITDRPIAYIDSLETATTANKVKRGRVSCTGFDCSGGVKEQKVYCNADGTLTLIPTAIEVGVIEDNTNPGIVYFNIGGAGSGGSLTGTHKRLGAIDIDGSTNAIDTDKELYVCPASTYTRSVKIYLTNRNGGYTAKVRVAHVDGAIASVANEDYILYDDYLLPYETKIIEIPGMIATDSLLIRSNTTNVNFTASGEEMPIDVYNKRVAAIDIDGSTNVVNTDYAAYTTNRATKVCAIICNRDQSNYAEVQIAHVNSNDIANIADEDRKYFSLAPAQTLFLDLDMNMATAEILSLRSDLANVNMLVYLTE